MMTLARERQAAEGTGMHSALPARACGELTLCLCPPLPPTPGGPKAAGPGRRSGGDVGGVVLLEAEGGAFECRTCRRRFPSFQALGGHRTSHTRLQARRVVAQQQQQQPTHGHKARAHGCAVCGLEFPMGQALGGHMRLHKGEARVEEQQQEMLDLNYPPLEDRGGDQEECSSGSEPPLLDLLVATSN